MLKVYKWNINLGNEDAYNASSLKLLYSEDTNTIDFDLTTIFKQNLRSFVYTLDIESNKGSVFDFAILDTENTAVIDKFKCYDYIDRNCGYGRLDLRGGGDVIKFARAVIDDDGNVFITLSRPFGTLDCGDSEIDVMDVDEHSSKYYLLRDCAWFADRVKLLDKKKRLISNTDIYRNVGYLEAQVDLLTKLVLALTEGKTDDETKQLLQMANEYSVLNIKPTTAIEEEFTENKANFRKIQEQYYESLK